TSTLRPRPRGGGVASICSVSVSPRSPSDSTGLSISSATGYSSACRGDRQRDEAALELGCDRAHLGRARGELPGLAEALRCPLSLDRRCTAEVVDLLLRLLVHRLFSFVRWIFVVDEAIDQRLRDALRATLARIAALTCPSTSRSWSAAATC